MKLRKKKQSMFAVLLEICIIPIALLAIIFTVIATVKFKHELISGAESKLKAVTEQTAEYFAYDLRTKGAVDYEEYADCKYIDSLKDDNIEITLFENDVRLLTSVKDESGKRLEGTKADFEIWKTVKAGNDFFDDNVIIDGTRYCVYYSPVYTDDNHTQIYGMSFAGEPYTDIQSALNGMFFNMLGLAVVISLIVALILFFIARKITVSMKGVVANLHTLSTGDLNIDRNISSSIKDLTQIIASTLDLSDSLTSITTTMKKSSTAIVNSNENINSGIVTSSDNVTNVSSVSQELSASMELVSSNVEEITASTEEVFATIEMISVQSEEGKTMVRGMKERATNSQKFCSDSLNQILEILSTKKAVLDEAITASKKVSEISELTESILQISSTTNLLSLNASIEAARAGEAGRGFVVVAGEIRKLADASKETAENIQCVSSNVIKAVEDLMTTSDEIISYISEKVENDYKRFSGVGQSYFEDADKVASIIEAYSDGTNNLKGATEKVVDSITYVSSSIDQCSQGVGDVATSISNIASELGSIRDSSEESSQNINKLDEQLAQFK